MKTKYFLSVENKNIPGQYHTRTKSKYEFIDKEKKEKKVTKIKKTIMIKNTVPYIVHTCETNKIQYSNNIYSKQFLFIISSNNEVSILNRC